MSSAKSIKVSSLRDAAAKVVESGLEQGADRVKCVTKSGVESRLVVENGEFSLANTMQSRALGVGVHCNSRKGSASTNCVDEAGIQDAVKEALALASFSLPDENLVMATKEQAPLQEGLSFLYSEQAADLDLTGLGELMKEALAHFKVESRFNLDRFEFSSGVSCHGVSNSLGVVQEEYQTTIGWSYLGMARDGEQVSGMDYQGGFSFSLDNLREKLLGDIDLFLSRIVGCLRPIKCPAYKGPILIAPRAVNQLIVSPLLFHMSGRSVMDGKSRWKDSVGKRVVSDKLTLVDNPHSKDLIGATAFDSDGLPTSNRKIFTEGLLNSHLQDLYSAKKLGVAPTGTAGGPFCLSLVPGDVSFDEMVAMSPQILLVTRFSGNIDPLTGDFSGLAKSSRLFEKGEDKGAVGETMIAGNVFDLANNVMAVGGEAENVGGSYLAPPLLVDGATVS